MALYFISRRLSQGMAMLAIPFAITRVYVGVHFPVDVIAGLLFGGLIAVAVWMITRGPATRFVRKMRESALGSLALWA